MLLDPAKEQLHLPATLIELGDGERRQEKVVGKKHQAILTQSIVVMNSAKPLGVTSFGDGIVERDDLVRSQTAPLVDCLRAKPPTIESSFGPSHKEGSRLVHAVESSKIEIGTIHQINSARFPDQLVEDVDLVDLPAGDNYHRGDGAAKVQKCVQLDGRFAAAELSPRKQRQAQIDRGGIERVDGLIEFDSEGLLLVELACCFDQHMSELGIDSPIADLIGMGQGISRDPAPNAHVIELGRSCSQARFDVSETLSIGQLGKRHAEKLIPAREARDFVVAVITLHAAAKFV